ncbi:hypothetical protein Q8A67_011931 [Cirrhinus molitorella]|uniref:Uncharacterized protein n=1 Tax=Cirrhinus molitorella TaxID=172907 RepID=A0AA88PP61_9TELE|nr:hypothetical protein Q8A67_011931 [Cirrhinus molitorella]
MRANESSRDTERFVLWEFKGKALGTLAAHCEIDVNAEKLLEAWKRFGSSDAQRQRQRSEKIFAPSVQWASCPADFYSTVACQWTPPAK